MRFKLMALILIALGFALYFGCAQKSAPYPPAAGQAPMAPPPAPSSMPSVLMKSGAAPSVMMPVPPEFNTEQYDYIGENPFKDVVGNPLSTFSIDVDTASYANVRRFLNERRLPPADAVRVEELINYFSYNYPQPEGRDPFAFFAELSDCPWNKAHQLVHLGIQGKSMKMDNLPPSNLTFLIDVSGSMSDPNKLPLLKSAFELLVKQLRRDDKVAIVVYAGAAGLVLPPTHGSDKETILNAIQRLQAGGSTAGAAGIQLAYQVAADNLIKNGNNRVILATDGDFNVGVSSDSELVRMIEQRRDQGIFLTVLGFGMGNYKDSRMEKLADKGNGNYAYIDNLLEAKKVFVKDLTGTLFTIAKDVKIQVEFNPAKVKSYRLIGYETRQLNKEDFADDQKDAGELGAGHTVTALYEIVPAGSDEKAGSENLKYQRTEIKHSAAESGEIMTVQLRYKPPKEDVSKLLTFPVEDRHHPLASASENLRFSSAVAQFGLLLRNSEYKGDSSFAGVMDLAKKAKGADDEGYRAEFIRMVETAEMLWPKKDK